MSNLLNYENKFMGTVTRAVDAVILGLLWLVFSIPVVTVGAASSAFYYAYHKGVRQENSYPWKEFFHGFKANFKQATILWLVLLGLGLVLCLDVYILAAGALDIGNLVPLLLVSSLLILSIAAMWGLCAFPYIARFENTFAVMLKNSFMITLANLHRSLLLLVLFAAAVILFFTVPLLGLFLPAIYMFCANRILERIFRKYMRPEDLESQ